ncbi:transposase [Streptomyces sp. NPDC005009]
MHRSFRRPEPRWRAGEYLRGLLAPLGCKNGWTPAEQAGELCPDGMQRLLNQDDWDADAVRGFVLNIWVPRTVCRPWTRPASSRKASGRPGHTGTFGKIDNCQLGVFLAYASERGRAWIDRELYLPTSWTEDPARRADAEIGEEIAFRTKPARRWSGQFPQRCRFVG